LPDGAELVMRVMPMPADVNANGDVFGGWIMAQVDVAGAVLPVRVARGRIATVAVNEFTFKQPVSIGDLLSFYAASRASAARRSRCMSRSTPNATRPTRTW
jgi:acyl-CoA thioesterase YciA